MKNLKAIGLLALAVIAGLAAAVFAANWLGQRANIASNKVVVASVDIELGTKLNPQMLEVVDWPAGSTPPGAFSDLKELQDRVVRMSLGRGEAVLDRKLMPQGAQGGLSAVIAEGKRAMTVRVNDVIGVAGFALPGNYVDVMVNAQQDPPQGGRPIPVSMTVLEHVLVLAVAQEASRDDTKPKVVSAVTLELSLEDAEKLDLARSVGTLSLVLRNQMDKDTVATKGISKNELFRLKENATKVATAPAPAAPKAPARKKPRSAPAVARAPEPVVPVVQPAPAPQDCIEVMRNGTRAVSCF